MTGKQKDILFRSVLMVSLFAILMVPVSAIQFSDVEGRGVWCNGHSCGYPTGTEHNESLAWDGNVKTGNIVYQYPQGWQQQYDLFIFPSNTTLTSCEIWSGNSVEFGGSCFSGPHNYAFINSSYMIWSAPMDEWSTITFDPPVYVGTSFSISTPTGGQCWRINETRCFGWNTTYSDITSANFTATPLLGAAPLPVLFNDTSTNAPISWSWDFGDGGTSAEQNPLHTYTIAGTYDVSLNVTNSVGSNTTVKEEYVTVTEPEPEVFTYSITNSMYLNKTPTKASLETITAVTSRLGDVAHWRPVFSEQGPVVTPGHFEGISQEPTSHSLNDATLHFHVGHGYPPDRNNDTALQLLSTKSSDGMNYDGYQFFASEVQNKWGGKNKWVVLQTCYTLKDKKWGQKMGTTHGIFGFSTVSNNKAALEDTFLNNAIDGKSLYDSWYLATTLELKNDDVSSYYTADGEPAKDPKYIDAVVYFKTEKQMSQDHLPGYGGVAGDGEPNNIDFFYDAWNVHTGEKVTL